MGRITRRKVLGGSVAAAGAIAAVFMPIGQRPSTASADDKTTKKRHWVMAIDMRRCDGCRKCTEACQTAHKLPKTFEWIKVNEVVTKVGTRYFMPVPCQQCENAPCLRVCPVGATFKAADGVILVDQDRCIGCRMCMAACPFGRRYFNDSDPPTFQNPFGHPTPEYPVPQQKGTVGKCMFCVHQTEQGKLPACVEVCSMLALYIGDAIADVATNGKDTVRLSEFLRNNDAWRYKEELNTGPNVYYITGHGQDLEF
ncbi:MAG: 4Fe-4S dicluster domain-containing protein [Chloroflexota bacterium]|nr:4Fe-4S dicluster domain-containing protein [Chloroflexota bacterium]